MAKIYSDVLLIGDDLAGMLAAALLAKRGLRVAHFPKPYEHYSIINKDLFPLWPSLDDPLSRVIFDELELNLELNRSLSRHENFALIDETHYALDWSFNRSHRQAELERVFKDSCAGFLGLIEEISPFLLEKEMKKALVPHYPWAFLTELHRNFLTRFYKVPEEKQEVLTLDLLFKKDPGRLTMPQLNTPHYGLLNSCYQSALLIKYGINLPKDESLTIFELLQKLLLQSIKRHSGIIADDRYIKKICEEKNRIKELESSMGESYVARYIIDATPTDFSHLKEETSSLKQEAHTKRLVLETTVAKELVSIALPRTGFFYCNNSPNEAAVQYQLFLTPNKNNIRVVLSSPMNHKEMPFDFYENRAKSILERHFSLPNEMPNYKITEHNQRDTINVDSTSFLPSVRTKYANVFKASSDFAAHLGFFSSFASAFLIYKSLEKKLALKRVI
jgi:hypothetical protein